MIYKLVRVRKSAFGKKLRLRLEAQFAAKWTPIDCHIDSLKGVFLIPLDGDALFIFQSFLFGLMIKPKTIIK